MFCASGHLFFFDSQEFRLTCRHFCGGAKQRSSGNIVLPPWKTMCEVLQKKRVNSEDLHFQGWHQTGWKFLRRGRSCFESCFFWVLFLCISRIRKLTLPETNSSPLKLGRNPKGKDHLPTIHFQGLLLLVSGRLFAYLEPMSLWASNLLRCASGTWMGRRWDSPVGVSKSNVFGSFYGIWTISWEFFWVPTTSDFFL